MVGLYLKVDGLCTLGFFFARVDFDAKHQSPVVDLELKCEDFDVARLDFDARLSDNLLGIPGPQCPGQL